MRRSKFFSGKTGAVAALVGVVVMAVMVMVGGCGGDDNPGGGGSGTMYLEITSSSAIVYDRAGGGIRSGIITTVSRGDRLEIVTMNTGFGEWYEVYVNYHGTKVSGFIDSRHGNVVI